MPTGTMQAGQVQTVSLGTNTGKLRTVVTLSGRDSGRVIIRAREFGASSATSGNSGDNEINMAVESTVTIEGASIDDVVIDDSYNPTLGPINYTVTQYTS